MPKYLDAVPLDPFAREAPLRYRTTDEGFLLYSIGMDRKDDAGQDYMGGIVGDLVVRFPPRIGGPPPPPLKKKAEEAAGDAD